MQVSMPSPIASSGPIGSSMIAALHEAKHPAADLGTGGVESNALDGRDCSVVDRAEHRDQRRNAIGPATVLVPPGTGRMKSEHGIGEIIVELQLAMDVKISLGERSSRIDPLVPDRHCALDTDVIVLVARPLCRFTLDCRAVEPRPSRCIDAPVLLVSGLPFREAELLPDMVFADDRVVARE